MPSLRLLLLVNFFLIINLHAILIHAKKATQDDDHKRERPSDPINLLDIVIEMSPSDYISHWNAERYVDYLIRTGDINIEVKPWHPIKIDQHDVHHRHHFHGLMNNLDSQKRIRRRVVTTHHPVNVPHIPGIGLPRFVESVKIQTLHEGSNFIILHEVNEAHGFPFSDRFHVVLIWKAVWNDSHNKKSMHLSVTQHVVFKKPFWLEKTVERNSEKETRETINVWSNMIQSKSADVQKSRPYPGWKKTAVMVLTSISLILFFNKRFRIKTC